MNDDLREALARIEERQAAHIERYIEDRKETKERYQAEREERKAWRDSMEKTVTDLRSEIAPVVRDHKMVVGFANWVGGGSGLVYSVVKVWHLFKERL